MTNRAIDLALRKQTLQLESAHLRSELARHGTGLAPVATVADGVRTGWQWVRGHPEFVVGAAVVLVVTRPRQMWRWLRRGWAAWRTWRLVKARLENTARASDA